MLLRAWIIHGQVGKGPHTVKTGSSAFMILTLTNITTAKNTTMVAMRTSSGKSQSGRGPQRAISCAKLIEDLRVFYGNGRNGSNTHVPVKQCNYYQCSLS